jgi:hypothetical protein
LAKNYLKAVFPFGAFTRNKNAVHFFVFLFRSAYESELSTDEGLASLIHFGGAFTKAKTLPIFLFFYFPLLTKANFRGMRD